MYVALADNQDITRAGMMYVCQEMGEVEMRRAEDKAELLEQLKSHPDAVVVLDYTLFDINDVEELTILHQRFPGVQWILFSVDLSGDFVRRVIAIAPRFSILLKESPIQEIRECLMFGQRHQRYICQRMAELLLAPQVVSSEEDVKLTPTEMEILKDIALGQTTREIAERRFSSFHTVNTHRKNIFRKLGVNNVHEATKYALRAGLVDSAEYYI
ncbi:MAG: response regulator transcription factor [Prevotella sp.]|nr:response regulator transcription factor [Prevotella sp.]